jgi:hypothetical protein
VAPEVLAVDLEMSNNPQVLAQVQGPSLVVASLAPLAVGPGVTNNRRVVLLVLVQVPSLVVAALVPSEVAPAVGSNRRVELLAQVQVPSLVVVAPLAVAPEVTYNRLVVLLAPVQVPSLVVASLAPLEVAPEEASNRRVVLLAQVQVLSLVVVALALWVAGATRRNLVVVYLVRSVVAAKPRRPTVLDLVVSVPGAKRSHRWVLLGLVPDPLSRLEALVPSVVETTTIVLVAGSAQVPSRKRVEAVLVRLQAVEKARRMPAVLDPAQAEPNPGARALDRLVAELAIRVRTSPLVVDLEHLEVVESPKTHLVQRRVFSLASEGVTKASTPRSRHLGPLVAVRSRQRDL